MLTTLVTAAVPLTNFPSVEAHFMPLPKAAPSCPRPAKAAPVIAPVIAPEKAPSSNPSRNEPPLAILSSPPDTPPMQAPRIAPQQAPAIIGPTPGIKRTTIDTATITMVAINFQCSLHHSQAFFIPSAIFSMRDFSHSGFRYEYLV